MDRQLSKIMSVLFLILILWFGFSIVGRVSWLLPIAVTWFAIINVLTSWAIREFSGTIAKLARRRFVRGYLKFVCHMIGDELPIESTSTSSRRRLLLRTAKEYLVAADRAKQIFRGQNDIINSLLARIRENQSLREKRRDDNALPLGSFFLIGHEGSGKRYLSRVLSKLIYGSGTIDVFDCSRINAGMLIGNRDQPGELIRLVQQRSYRTILFERIEKADEDTTKTLLSMLAKGKVALPGARQPVSFENTLIFFSTTEAVSELQSLADKQASGSTLTTSSIELLTSQTGMDRALLTAITDTYLFEPSSDQVKAEVLSLLMQRECRSHEIELAFVEPKLLASQVCRIDDQNGFRIAPQMVNRLLRKPLVAATAANQTSLALRVRHSSENKNELFKIG